MGIILKRGKGQRGSQKRSKEENIGVESRERRSRLSVGKDFFFLVDCIAGEVKVGTGVTDGGKFAYTRWMQRENTFDFCVSE